MNQLGVQLVDDNVFESVLNDIKNGHSFPTLERTYQRAIGNSADRKILLHLLAEQAEEETEFDEDFGRVFLKKVRKDAEDMDIQYVDQVLPRLLDIAFGPVLTRGSEKPGIYEFVNPVFRLYVRLRNF